MNLKELIINKLPQFKDIRRTLHNNAELSNQEFKTSKIIQNYLASLGLSYKKLSKYWCSSCTKPRYRMYWN